LWHPFYRERHAISSGELRVAERFSAHRRRAISMTP
jgi:hypothetical protein